MRTNSKFLRYIHWDRLAPRWSRCRLQVPWFVDLGIARGRDVARARPLVAPYWNMPEVKR